MRSTPQYHQPTELTAAGEWWRDMRAAEESGLAAENRSGVIGQEKGNLSQLLSRNEKNQILNRSVLETSSVLQDPKGYVEFPKMLGRSRFNFYSTIPEPHDKRFEYNPGEKRAKVRGENLLRMSRYTGRYKVQKKSKQNYAAPFYNPNYKAVQKNVVLKVPNFSYTPGRRDQTLRQNCLNEYDVVESSEVEKLPVPDFDKMYGRDTLKSKKMFLI